MISKATGWQNSQYNERPARLKGVMRAVMNWAALEEHDSVLDLNCGDGTMLRKLGSRMRLYSCGMCPDPGEARAARESLDEADIVYGTSEDIPWHDAAFDVVLGTELLKKDRINVSLKEICRVLRPGGQIVLATKLTAGCRDGVPGRTEVMRAMQINGFESVSWRIYGLHGVAIGWKKREC